MSHIIVDPDSRFIINADDRSITNASGERLTIMQYDHNSERVTFELPRYIEGHDMSLCDLVMVLFDNTSKGTSVSTRNVTSGVYKITDLAVDKNDPEKLTFTWLIGSESTQYNGTLKFQLEFSCYENEKTGVPSYNWHTDQCQMIDILPTLNSADNMVTYYPNVITDMDSRLTALETNGVPENRLATAINEYFTANPVEKLTAEELQLAITQYFYDNPVDTISMTDVDTAINNAILKTYKNQIIDYVIAALPNGDEVSY